MEAGADTTASFGRVFDHEGSVILNGSPLAFTAHVLRKKKVRGKESTLARSGFTSRRRSARLVLRVEAVHTVSCR